MLELGIYPQAIFIVSLKINKAMALFIKESSSGKSFNVWDGPTLNSFSKKTFPAKADVEKFIAKSKGKLTGAVELAPNRLFFGETDRGEELDAEIKSVSYKKAETSSVVYEEEEA